MIDLLASFDAREFFSLNPIFTYLWISLVGLIVGSFINVVIIRLPVIEELVSDSSNVPLPKTLMGRSYCPCCGEKIPARHNIPLFSWIYLRGKSACCKQAIHWRYPAIEILSSATAALALWTLGMGEQLAIALVAAWMLIALVAIDIEHKFLPDRLTIPLLWVGLLSSCFDVFQSPADAIIGAAFGYGFLWFIGFVYEIRHKKVGLGQGDMKLLAALGALSGMIAVPGIMAGALITFAIFAVPCLLLGKVDKVTKLCFGPFIATGFVAWILLGPYY